MPMTFRAADALSSAALDLVMGEELLHTPWKSGVYSTAGGADATRPVRTAIGMLGGGFSDQGSDGDKLGGSFRGGQTRTRDRSASFDIKDWPDDALWPKKGDLITQVETGYVYQLVADAYPDGINRIYCDLVIQ